MNNELERILGEVADSASHRTGTLPIGELRARGVRRRRTRQAGYSVVGVAAAFGLAFGAAQILPDAGPVGPADSPTAPLPTADTSALLGACGTDVTNLPAIDGSVWLELSSTDVTVPVWASSPVEVTVQNFGANPLDLSLGSGPYLFAARDGVVVGFSWPTTVRDSTPIESGGEDVRDDFGPFVECFHGEVLPAGSPSARTPLPVGEYTIHSALTLRADELRDTSEFPWAFDVLGRAGTLTVTEEEPASDDLTAVDLALPVCGAPIEGFELPPGVQIDDFPALEVTVGHTGEDADGVEEFFGEGYGDQLRVTFDHVNAIESWGESRELGAAVVIAHEGVVVAEMSWPEWSEVRWNSWPRGEGRSIGPVGDWVDCASGEQGQVPKGDYEILGWRTVEVTRPDGSTGAVTVGYPASAFTAYDFEDPDNPGPSATD